jgi:subtilisin family serine protease
MKKLFLLMAVLLASAALTPAIAAAQATKGVLYTAKGKDGIKDRYIVVLKDTDHTAQKNTRTLASDLTKKYRGSVKHTYKKAMRGFVASMSESDARKLAKNPNVKFVEQDAMATADATQLNPNTWGIDRIDQRALPLDTAYTYPDVSASGVTAYVIDSGIRTTHNEFGGRAVDGWDFVEDDAVAQDCKGHGTHVAGVIGSGSYGVAKDINLVGVRVLDCSGNGTYSDIIAGIDWVTANATLPAVANVSLGGINSLALDGAVQNSIAAGITYAVSAGNNSTDACTQSPARAADAITVAATNDLDERWASSNYGACVDLFAPGVSVRSAYMNSNTSTARMTGTSQAAPHVTGVAALMLATDPTLTPTQIRDAIVTNATVSSVVNSGPDSPNLLLFQ